MQALNQQWNTTFASWEEAQGATRHEMRDVSDGNYAAWSDHRAFIDDVFASAFIWWQDGLRSADPRAKIGISGQSQPSCYNGFDYAKLSGIRGTMNMYIWISQGELWTSLFSGKAYTHWTGYGQPDADIRYGIWFSVAQQHHGISYFKVPWFFTPNLRLNAHARFIRDNLRPVKEGIGKIAMTARKDHGGIAILYSQPSMRTAWITSADKPMARESVYEYHERDQTNPDYAWDEVRYLDNLDTYCMLLKAGGFSYRFVSDEQVDNGVLQDEGYRVVILPFAMSLSDRTSARIDAFVKDGGMAIADTAPGVMDEHCTLRTRSSLATLFGATFSGTPWSRKPVKVRSTATATPPLQAFAATCLGTLQTTTNTGRPMATAEAVDGETPVLILNKAGDGRTIFLIFFPSHLKDRVTWHRDSNLLRQLLGTHGIEPACAIDQGGRPALN